jgi:phosphate uptake regulator
VLNELLRIFRSQGPGSGLREELDEMIRRSAELVELAGDAYFQRGPKHGEPRDIAAEDKKINKLQRQIRKDALLRAVASEDGFDLPFCLSLMNVVKDVERIGDYAKDLAKLAEKAPASDGSPYDHLALEAEKIGVRMAQILQESDQIKAVNLIEEGKDLRRRLNAELFARVASDELGAGRHVLCLQYYLRIVGHMMNVLSTIVTPLHRMDYTGKRNLLPEVKAKLGAAGADK